MQNGMRHRHERYWAARPCRGVRAITATVLLLFGIVTGPSPTMGAQQTLAEYVMPRQGLVNFEVYHISESALYRNAISLQQLLQMTRVDDYVRVDARHSEAVADLYRALGDAAIDPRADCPSAIDARWAIALNYRDGTREAVGFRSADNCMQLLSRNELVSVSPALLRYVERTFPFMRSR